MGEPDPKDRLDDLREMFEEQEESNFRELNPERDMTWDKMEDLDYDIDDD